MLVASMSFTLRLYSSNSLKEKRFVLLSVKKRLRNRFNVAVSEVGEHDSWRTAAVGLVTVGTDKGIVDAELTAITRFLDGDVRFELCDRLVEYF